jgi:hypothetical protein
MQAKQRDGTFREADGEPVRLVSVSINQASSPGLAMIPLFLPLGRSQADPHGPLGVRFSGMAAGVPLFVAAGSSNGANSK